MNNAVAKMLKQSIGAESDVSRYSLSAYARAAVDRMGSIFVFNRQQEDESNLGAPDDSEADNLKHHVGRCALRFRFLARGQAAQATRIQRIEVILYGIAIWLFATSPFAQGMLKKLLGF